MNETKVNFKGENLNESSEISNLLKELNLETENHTMNRFEADDIVTKRIELQKSFNIFPKKFDSQINENFTFNDVDKEYMEKLKYDLNKCNPNYKLDRKWQINCQRCVPTFEIRRRGFDVTAKPCDKRFDWLSLRPFDVWKNPDVIKAEGNGKQTIKNKMSEWGDGARAQVVVMWKGVPSGHTFFAERVNGKTLFFDPQNGSTDVTKYFDRVQPNSVSFCRVDNLQPSEKINDCLRRV